MAGVAPGLVIESEMEDDVVTGLSLDMAESSSAGCSHSI